MHAVSNTPSSFLGLLGFYHMVHTEQHALFVESIIPLSQPCMLVPASRLSSLHRQCCIAVWFAESFGKCKSTQSQ
jgi:hypothetical protein